MCKKFCALIGTHWLRNRLDSCVALKLRNRQNYYVCNI